jgi:hypothetical protein
MKVAFIIPSTSKNRDWENPIDSYLYKTINSIKDTCIVNFKIKIFVGVDSDDIFYNNESNINFLLNQGIQIKFIKIDVEKGHVTKIWNKLAKICYKKKYDYIYGCGDDILFNENGWLIECINKLRQHKNIGLTGPKSINGNTRILTQCFVHRKHFKIFGFFYPDEIKNWYCDDWINEVYKSKTYRLSNNYFCENLSNNVENNDRYKIIKCPQLKDKLVKRDRKILKSYLK